MKSTHAISIFLAAASATFSMVVLANQNIPGVGTVVKPNATATPPTEECVRYPERCKDAKAPPKKSAAFAAKLVDINTATKAQLAEIPTLNAQMVDFLIVMRQKGPFRDSADLAARVCGLAAVNLEETNIKIGQQQILYRGVDPKSPGWRCGSAPNTYTANNVTYNSR